MKPRPILSTFFSNFWRFFLIFLYQRKAHISFYNPWQITWWEEFRLQDVTEKVSGLGSHNFKVDRYLRPGRICNLAFLGAILAFGTKSRIFLSRIFSELAILAISWQISLFTKCTLAFCRDELHILPGLSSCNIQNCFEYQNNFTISTEILNFHL